MKMRGVRAIALGAVVASGAVVSPSVAGAVLVAGGAMVLTAANAAAGDPDAKNACTYYSIGHAADAFTSRRLPGRFHNPKFSPTGKWFVADSTYEADMGRRTTDRITNVVKYPLKIDLQISDEKGNPYSLENVH